MHHRSRVAWRIIETRETAALAVALLLALLLVLRVGWNAPPAEAHPLALSGFDAWAGERDLRVDFKLDAPSVLTALAAARPGQPAPSLGAIREHRQVLFDYITAHLRFSNEGQPCPLDPAGGGQVGSEVLVNPATAKVLLELRFVCPQALRVLTIESTLFNEQSPAPTILCSFHYNLALEHYFFTGGMRLATVPVRELKQALPAVIDQSRPFAMAEAPPDAYAREAAAPPPKRNRGGFVAFIGQGVLHILSGFDHVLFVVSLLLAVRTRRELVLVVTSFTLAHSLTLVLGTFDLLSASPRLVEPLIALSIVYVAGENLVRRGAAHARPAVTFGFGLVHGLGFSAALRELGLPARDLVGPLIGFNLGVELGQLTIVLPLLPLILWLRNQRAPWFTRMSLLVNAVVALVAGVWFVQRIVAP